MAEVREEAEHVWATKAHIALFLSAMRHFCDHLRGRGVEVYYQALDAPDNRGSLGTELQHAVEVLHPEKLIVVEPGEWRVDQMLKQTAKQVGIPLEIRSDQHFYCSRDAFAEHTRGRKQLLMERFYREMRREHGVLLDDGEPVGGEWNYDARNRQRFGPEGPGAIPAPRSFPPDETTHNVLALVEERFAEHPGGLARFDWPVTREQAKDALADFVSLRLAQFGPYQDAMWAAEPYLYHSRLSAALNLKLLDPREVIAAAERAYQEGIAPLPSVEGFVRQVLGWREYVRGIYWWGMPKYAERNALEAELSLPGFYWTADTEMRCLHECLQQTLEYSYAHHIQRLMVTGLYALLLGVRPVEVHEWYLAVYVDAVEWVELPNTLGMSQYADGGIMATKPYCASGQYIQRMSNYCGDCRYDPARRLGEEACPYTTLYWDFLMRNRDRLRGNARMGLQYRNLDRIGLDEQRAVRLQAERVRSGARPR